MNEVAVENRVVGRGSYTRVFFRQNSLYTRHKFSLDQRSALYWQTPGGKTVLSPVYFHIFFWGGEITNIIILPPYTSAGVRVTDVYPVVVVHFTHQSECLRLGREFLLHFSRHRHSTARRFSHILSCLCDTYRLYYKHGY